MTDILFYHLERQPLIQVLPALLEKCLERGWRVVVQVESEERCEALNAQLWTYRDDSFLPHGTRADGEPQTQPIFITVDEDNPNDAQVRFLVGGANLTTPDIYERVVTLIDGHDPEAIEKARGDWRRLTKSTHNVTYWQQSGTGKWENRSLKPNP